MKRTADILVLVLAAAMLAWPCRAADKEDWGAALAGDGADEAAAPTGIIGMSTDDLAGLKQGEEAEADDEKPADFISGRRRFVMREFRFNADWNTDPTAVPAFVEQLKRRTGMKALALSPRKALTFSDPELTEWPFVFMTAHNAFTFSDADIKNLRNYLYRGGFIYSDDCLYGFPYGQALPGELQRAFPEIEFKPLGPKEPVLSTVFRQKYSWAKPNEAGLPSVMKPNSWYHLDVNGHIAFLHSPQDIGCLWEISSPPTPSNPLGAGMHSMDMVPGIREAAYQLGVNVVLYSLLH